MGAKVINILMFLGSISSICQIVGLYLPLHTVSWFTLHLVRIFRMKTYALSVGLQHDSNDFCKLIEQVKPGFCDGIYDDHDLQEVAQRFCAPVLADLFPSACIGLTRAFLSGLALVIVSAINISAVAISCYLFFSYINGSRKAQQRGLAQGLLAGSTGLFACALLIYAVMVLVQLDQMQPVGGQLVGILLSANRGSGVSSGFFVLALACLVQIVMLAISGNTVAGDEITEEMLDDIKMRKEVDAEMQRNNLMYGASNANGYVGNYGAADYEAQTYGPQHPVMFAPSAPPGAQSFVQPQSFAQPLGTSSFGLPPSNNSYAQSGW